VLVAALILLVCFGGSIFDDTGASTTQPASSPQPLTSTLPDLSGPGVHLLGKIKIKRDKVRGSWKGANGGRPLTNGDVADDQTPDVLVIHVTPTAEYDWNIHFVCKVNAATVAMGCPTEHGTLQWSVGPTTCQATGGAGLPAAIQGSFLKEDEQHTMTVKVRSNGIECYLDNKMLVAFNPQTQRLDAPQGLWDGFNASLPSLGVKGGQVEFSVVYMTESGGQPEKTPDRPAPVRRQPREAPESDTTAAIKPGVKEIRGLVVTQGGDGGWHGQAMDLIATVTQQKYGSLNVRQIGDIGPEMSKSLDEAKRLLAVRHPDLKGANVEISFGDKYTPMDGGSAGGAFAVLLLAAVGDFDLDPDAAMTGDITVDGKIRPVGAVSAKVHGAALDKCRLVSIPAANTDDVADAYLMRGPTALWETQIFSAGTLDEAIANMRADHDEKMTQAMSLFDELKSDYGDKPISALSQPAAHDKLKQIVALAPNDVSAADLLLLADGKGPTHLGAVDSIEEAIMAIGPLRTALFAGNYDPSLGTEEATAQEMGALRKVRRLADPVTAPFIAALTAYVTSYREWATAQGRGNYGEMNRATADLRQKIDAVSSALEKVGSNSDLIDKMMHK
jgi:hypothetical protein